MKRIVLIGIVLTSIFLLFQFSLAIDFPKPQGFVNDFTGILTQEQKSEFELLLQEFERETSNEIAIAIVSSLEGLDRFSYSQELFTAWKIGKPQKNNGILFLIALSEREAFINVGKGLEGALPDSLAGSILRNEVFPFFKSQQYADGIRNGLAAMIKATKGEYSASRKDSKGSVDWLAYMASVGGWGIWFLFIFIIHSVSFFLGRTRSWWLGGVLGGVGGFMLGFIFLAGLFIVLPAIFFGVIGLIFDYVVSKNYAIRKQKGLRTDFWHSGGGFWFGGRGGGFSGGGSGFGGFGGGISGGGGAGGRW